MRRAASSAGVTRDASSAKRRPMPPRRASSRVPVAGGKLGAITAAVETVSARCGGKEGSGSARETRAGGLGRGDFVDVARRSRANCRSARAGFAGDATHLAGVRAARRTHGRGDVHASSSSRLATRAGGRQRRARAGRQTCNARHRSWVSPRSAMQRAPEVTLARGSCSSVEGRRPPPRDLLDAEPTTKASGARAMRRARRSLPDAGRHRGGYPTAILRATQKRGPPVTSQLNSQ